MKSLEVTVPAEPKARGTIRWGAFVPYLAFLLIFAFFAIFSPDRFITYRNFTIILQQASVLAVVAFGMHFVIALGSIDLSVGSVLALAGMVGAGVAVNHGWVGLPVGIVVGGLAGLFNGLIFTYLKVPSFIVTLGTLLIARGLTVMYSQSNPIPLDSSLFFLGGYPNILYVTIAVFTIMFVIYKYSLFGRYTVGIGGDEKVSRLSGVPVNRTKVLVFVVSGLLAGLGGVMMASRLGAATPTVGSGFELTVISAVVLGGTPLTGGVGNLQNTVLGAIITAMLGNGLVILGVSSEAQQVITGLILIAAVFVSLERSKIGIIK